MAKVWCQAAAEEENTQAQILSEQWFKSDFSVFAFEAAPWTSLDMTLEVYSEYPPADYFEPGTVFTVSDRLKAMLEEFKVRAEFFPVRVAYEGRDYTERAFFFCNILDCVECLDLNRGEYTFWKKPGFTDRVDAIKRLALDESKVAGHDLFRIGKGAEYIVGVSDRLGSRIAQQRYTGVRLDLQR